MKGRLIVISAAALVLALLLALVPACGNGDVEPTPGVTPTPGQTPTPGVTPTPTGEVKTLKIGVLLPLSGPGAAWGLPDVAGVEWGRDAVDDAGGIKVGNDTYMIELVVRDSKMTGSVSATAAHEFIDMGIKFVVGPILTMPAVDPIFAAAGVIFVEQDASVFLGPDSPYQFGGGTVYEYWLDCFYSSARTYHPELETLVIVYLDVPNSHANYDFFHGVPVRNGFEVVDEVWYDAGTTDFYPLLTRALAKNPDAIMTASAGPGDMALIVKQARELGFTGYFTLQDQVDASTIIDVAGASSTYNILTSVSDWTASGFSQHARDLFEVWQQNYRLPGEEAMNITTRNGYAAIQFYKSAIERAGSIDTTEVLRVVDEETDWTFDNLFFPAVKPGGLEYYGIKRFLPQGLSYGEIFSADDVQLSIEVCIVEAP